MTAAEQIPGPLDGITVLDCTLLIQGPWAGQTLGDLGANVIKVEVPGRGDQGRWLPIDYPRDMRTPFAEAANRGKRSITLDLRVPAGRDTFLEMVKQSDIVITNFVPQTMERWGLGYDDLAAVNDQIIMGSGSGYGPLGPDAERPGADIGGQAQGGVVAAIHDASGRAAPIPFTIADHVGALNLTIGILAALNERNASGRGQRVEVSLYGSIIAAQAPMFTTYFLRGEPLTTSVPGHPLVRGLYGIFPTADGHLALVGVPGADSKQRFYLAIGRPDLLEVERFNEPVMQPEVQVELMDLMNDVFASRPTAEWADILRAADIRYAPVQTYEQIADDPGAWENGYLQTVNHHEHGEITAVGTPFRFSRTPSRPGATTPPLGANTEEVLLEFGFGWDQIADLQAAGAL